MGCWRHGRDQSTALTRSLIQRGAHPLVDIDVLLDGDEAVVDVPGVVGEVVGQRGVVHCVACRLQQTLHTLQEYRSRAQL